MVCLGAANDCVGSINGMTYQQCNEGEVVCFTGVGNNPITNKEHGYCLESSGAVILLGRTCPNLPCTENGSDLLDSVGFRALTLACARHHRGALFGRHREGGREVRVETDAVVVVAVIVAGRGGATDSHISWSTLGVRWGR